MFCKAEFEIYQDPFFSSRHENIHTQSSILRYLRISFFARISKNGHCLALETHFEIFEESFFLVWISKIGQRLASKHHFDMPTNLILFGYLKIAQKTILRCPMTHFFIRMAKNGQSSASEHHFMLFKDLFFVKTSKYGQSLATEHHFEML